MTAFEYLLIFFAVTGVVLGGGILLSQAIGRAFDNFNKGRDERWVSVI